MTDEAQKFAERVVERYWRMHRPAITEHEGKSLATLIASELRAGGWEPEPIGSMRIEPKELERLVRLAQRANPDVQFGHILVTPDGR